MAKRHKTILITGTVTGAYEGAVSELDSLHEEMDSWRSGLEDSGLDSTSKYDEVSECVEILERAKNEIDDLEMPEGAPGDWEITYQEDRPYGRREAPRWMRNGNAISMMQASIGGLQNYVDGDGDDHRDEGDIETVRELIESLERAVSELESVSFPAMF